MEIDFIKELFSGKKIYLTTDLPKDIFNGWKKVTAEEYEALVKVPEISVRVATRRNCVEVTDMIDFC